MDTDDHTLHDVTELLARMLGLDMCAADIARCLRKDDARITEVLRILVMEGVADIQLHPAGRPGYRGSDYPRYVISLGFVGNVWAVV